jgi:hypothetical protein
MTSGTFFIKSKPLGDDGDNQFCNCIRTCRIKRLYLHMMVEDGDDLQFLTCGFLGLHLSVVELVLTFLLEKPNGR